ncbi:unnamed protein product [Boreogadus saida]
MMLEEDALQEEGRGANHSSAPPSPRCHHPQTIPLHLHLTSTPKYQNYPAYTTASTSTSNMDGTNPNQLKYHITSTKGNRRGLDGPDSPAHKGNTRARVGGAKRPYSTTSPGVGGAKRPCSTTRPGVGGARRPRCTSSRGAGATAES